MIITAILFFIGAVLLNDFNNLRDARNGHINHTRALKIKVVSCLPSIVLFALSSNFRWVIALLSSTFLVGAYFFLFFEMLWSLKVYKVPFHKGTATGKNQSKTDNILEDWPIAAIIALKLALCIVSAWFYNIGLK